MGAPKIPEPRPLSDRLRPPRVDVCDPKSVAKAMVWTCNRVAEGVMTPRSGATVISGYRAALQYAMRCDERSELAEMQAVLDRLEVVKGYIDRHGAHESELAAPEAH